MSSLTLSTFRPSRSLTQRIIRFHQMAGFPIEEPDSAIIEEFRKHWGIRISRFFNSLARRTQDAIYKPGAPGVAAKKLCLVKNGTFPKEIHEGIGDMMRINKRGDNLIREVAREFYIWARKNRRKRRGPRAPIYRLKIKRNNVIAHLHPYVPPEIDPNYVLATVVE